MILSVCALIAGGVLQHVLQATPQQLEIQASTAWNQGDVQSAESLARRALFEAPESIRACDVLIQVALHDGRPDLQAAATAARSKGLGRELDGLLAAGDVAVGSNLLRLAELYWTEGLRQNSADVRLHQRLTAIAGMRLDLASMQARLLAWSEIGPPQPDLVLLYLGLASITERDAAGAFDLLLAAVEADQQDVNSKLGLGRCLFAMNKYDACAAIPSLAGAESFSLRAAALALAGRTDQAEPLLQQSVKEGEVDTSEGLRHFALGVVAGANKDWAKAEVQFALAVQSQPLSRPFRSRYCETLRRNGAEERLHEEVIRLEQLRMVVELAAAEDSQKDDSMFSKLEELCRAIGATEAAQILSISAGAR